MDNGFSENLEETNRNRYLEKKIDLPDRNNIGIKARVKAHISDAWSRAAIYFYPDGTDERVKIFEFRNVWSHKERETDWMEVERNLEQYRGQSGILSIESDGRWVYRRFDTTAWIKVDSIEVTTVDDSSGCTYSSPSNDGDDIPDCIEDEQIQVFGRQPSTSLLDSSLSDTDGDGLSDDQEIDIGEPKVTDDSVAEEVARVNGETKSEVMEKTPGIPWDSMPDNKNTDGVGFDDGEEVNPSDPRRSPSNPRKKEILIVGLSFATLVDDDTNKPLTIEDLIENSILPSDRYGEVALGPAPDTSTRNTIMIPSRSQECIGCPGESVEVQATYILASNTDDLPKEVDIRGSDIGFPIEKQATDFTAFFNVDPSNSVPKNYVFRTVGKVTLEVDLTGTRFFNESKTSSESEEYAVDIDQFDKLSDRVTFSERVTYEGQTVALSAANNLGSKESISFIPGLARALRQSARFYMWTRTDDEDKYKELTVRSVTNGIGAFGTELEKYEISDIPGKNTNVSKTGPVIFRAT